MFGMWQKLSPKNSQKRPRGKNVVNFSPGSSQSLTIFGGVQTLARGIRISYVRSGSPLSTTQPTSTHGTVLTCIMNASLERRQGHSGGFVQALKEVVFDKTLLKDIEQLTLNCHTGTLEMYHSVQLKYLSKRQHFSYKGMVARTQLAALDHNANTGRQQATVSRGENEGELRYKVVFPKQTKEWVAKPIMEKTREHLKPILDSIVARKLKDAADRSATLTAPHIPCNIATKPRPAKADVIAKHISRFPDSI